MSHTLVVGAAPVDGQEAFYRELLAAAPRVVAADAAAEWCVSLGRVPDVAVGDFDSSGAGAVERLRVLGADVVTAPCEKDETDLELALGVAGGLGDPIVLTAAFSMRPDHTLAAFGALLRAGGGATAREPGWTAWAVGPGDGIEVDLASGTTVSVIAVGEAVGVTVSGVAWPLEEATLGPLSGLGVSNVVTSAPLGVSTLTGRLVVIALDNPGDGLY